MLETMSGLQAAVRSILIVIITEALLVDLTEEKPLVPGFLNRDNL